MAVSKTFNVGKSTGNDISRVSYDLNKWVERIQNRAEEKVEEAVSTITNVTNSKYASDIEGRSQVGANPIYYRMYGKKNIITGVAIAKESKELIYIEFGTRRTANDNITIASGFASGINASLIAAPYKSNKPVFINNKASGGQYYFLGTIDVEGLKFIKNFWK